MITKLDYVLKELIVAVEPVLHLAQPLQLQLPVQQLLPPPQQLQRKRVLLRLGNCVSMIHPPPVIPKNVVSHTLAKQFRRELDFVQELIFKKEMNAGPMLIVKENVQQVFNVSTTNAQSLKTILHVLKLEYQAITFVTSEH